MATKALEPMEIEGDREAYARDEWEGDFKLVSVWEATEVEAGSEGGGMSGRVDDLCGGGGAVAVEGNDGATEDVEAAAGAMFISASVLFSSVVAEVFSCGCNGPEEVEGGENDIF